MEVIYWTTSALALVGVLLNIKKNRYCFMIWAVTNAVWALVDFEKAIYAQSALQFVYLYLSVYGFICWTAPERPAAPPEKKTEG